MSFVPGDEVWGIDAPIAWVLLQLGHIANVSTCHASHLQL